MPRIGTTVLGVGAHPALGLSESEAQEHPRVHLDLPADLVLFSVGVHRYTAAPRPAEPDRRLFRCLSRPQLTAAGHWSGADDDPRLPGARPGLDVRLRPGLARLVPAWQG